MFRSVYNVYFSEPFPLCKHQNQFRPQTRYKIRLTCSKSANRNLSWVAHCPVYVHMKILREWLFNTARGVCKIWLVTQTNQPPLFSAYQKLPPPLELIFNIYKFNCFVHENNLLWHLLKFFPGGPKKHSPPPPSGSEKKFNLILDQKQNATLPNFPDFASIKQPLPNSLTSPWNTQ